jgi:cysteine/O-acetylserine efflux protein
MMFSVYILTRDITLPELFFYAVYLMILGAIGNLIWAFAGSLLNCFYAAHYKAMNWIMALLLLWCALRTAGIL